MIDYKRIVHFLPVAKKRKAAKIFCWAVKPFNCCRSLTKGCMISINLSAIFFVNLKRLTNSTSVVCENGSPSTLNWYRINRNLFLKIEIELIIIYFLMFYLTITKIRQNNIYIQNVYFILFHVVFIISLHLKSKYIIYFTFFSYLF